MILPLLTNYTLKGECVFRKYFNPLFFSYSLSMLSLCKLKCILQKVHLGTGTESKELVAAHSLSIHEKFKKVAFFHSDSRRVEKGVSDRHPLIH